MASPVATFGGHAPVLSSSDSYLHLALAGSTVTARQTLCGYAGPRVREAQRRDLDGRWRWCPVCFNTCPFVALPGAMPDAMPPPADLLEELVRLCWRDGSLYGARPGRATRTLTVRGRRRYRIRLQTDICTAILTGARPGHAPYYPDLWPDVLRYVWRCRLAAATASRSTGA